jgi:hypothetical protein
VLTKERLAQILEVSRSLHGSGSLSVPALLGLARHFSRRVIRRSAETGTGASTLLASHLSEQHLVFAVNDDRSISSVLESPLLHRDAVTFIEGPSQKTLPAHPFREPLQAVLIDGPHAYPFPELEYFCFYPHLETGGLLVVDDIQIPTVHNLYRFLCDEQMFQLLEVCGTTAFFERTAAPVFDPWGDGWWLQGHNRKTLWRYAWPGILKGAVPEKLRRRLRRHLDRIRLGRY